MGAIVVTLGLRNCIIYNMLGLTFERALYWHKFFAIVALIGAVIHGIGEANGEDDGGDRRRLEEEDEDRSLTGYILIGLMGGMALVYLASYVNFNVFYFLHMTFFLAMIFLAFIHGATVLGILGIVWGVDILVRYVFTHRTTEAQLSLVGPKVVRLAFPRQVLGPFSPGQYCFLMVPAINRYEYHPFSITSSPDDPNEVVFCIKNCGDWTNALHTLATASTTTAVATTPIGIEGPYGSVGLDLFHQPCHEVVMLVGGGIGITPLLSLWSHLALSATTADSLAVRKVVIIWSVRDLAEAEGMYVSCLKGLVARSPQELTALPATELEEGAAPPQSTPGGGLVFEYHFHITSCKDATALQEAHQANQLTAPLGFWKPSRPSLPSLFAATAMDCAAQGFSQVAVCVSGTMPLIHETRNLCDRSRIMCGAGEKTAQIRFDCHEEVFGF
jgi:NADPH oxidase